MNEIKINVCLDHPHIPSILEYFINKKDYYLVFELEEGDFFTYIKNKNFLQEREASLLFG
jgi:serine/threonine protein kinase